MEKIKRFLESDKGKDILVVFIVLLVGIGSFELGRLSKNDIRGLKIEYTGTDSAQNSQFELNPNQSGKIEDNGNISDNNSQKNFFASSRGSKYYTLSCAAGKTIKPENRIYFTTGEEAEAAGYTLSSTCN